MVIDLNELDRLLGLNLHISLFNQYNLLLLRLRQKLKNDYANEVIIFIL